MLRPDRVGSRIERERVGDDRHLPPRERGRTQRGQLGHTFPHVDVGQILAGDAGTDGQSRHGHRSAHRRRRATSRSAQFHRPPPFHRRSQASPGRHHGRRRSEAGVQQHGQRLRQVRQRGDTPSEHGHEIRARRRARQVREEDGERRYREGGVHHHDAGAGVHRERIGRGIGQGVRHIDPILGREEAGVRRERRKGGGAGVGLSSAAASTVSAAGVQLLLPLYGTKDPASPEGH
mmetsp:Transcript_22243/g.65904  ORF Transcript_22243/g.65904 Transcript_22243/m.65904 type:complete len:234 (-) Transcript_22243:1000-1701(-)